MREKGKKDVFSFSRGKDWTDVCFGLQMEVEVGSRYRGLGYRHRRENGADAAVVRGWSTGGSPACGGLWPPDPAYPAYIP